MNSGPGRRASDLNIKFKIFHELMAHKIREILLILNPYDAFIMEEDASLATKIIGEYQGLNLSHPPRLTRVSSAEEALKLAADRHFDLAITMPQVGSMDAFTLGRTLKKIDPGLPVIRLAYNPGAIHPLPENLDSRGVDRSFLWSANPELLLALIKNIEDHENVDQDTQKAMVRVLILVEDSPVYQSFLLPIIYQEVVKQTQGVLDDSLNEEHRLLKMRARPKILVAESFEEALALYERYQPFVFGIMSDTRFYRHNELDDRAGIGLLKKIRRQAPDLPLLLLSSESSNRQPAQKIPAVFLDKNSPEINKQIHRFFLTHLGFGDFIFRLKDGTEVDRATNLHAFEKKLRAIPDESLLYHAHNNHFSNWVMARSEVELAANLHKNSLAKFKKTTELRKEIIDRVHAIRRWQQQGVVVRFSPQDFDPETMDFIKIGQGSMGGKALGLAFMAGQLLDRAEILRQKFPKTVIRIPKTLVITTDGFDSLVAENRLPPPTATTEDRQIAEFFQQARMPGWLADELIIFLAQIRRPLCIRSSSPREDAQHRPYAGLYETYMIPNNHPDPTVRLQQLKTAIKLVYASTYFAGPRAFSKTVSPMTDQESMAVIIQEAAGRSYGDFFYPAVSGVAQSHNFYPVAGMRAEGGIAQIALGFGKTVVEGERSLPFSPLNPSVLPQFSTVDDILANAQRYFYALKLKNYQEALNLPENSNLEKRECIDAAEEFPMQALASTYFPEEHRIRDRAGDGPKVLTCAAIFKHKIFPLPEILVELLELGGRGLGCPVELEFSADLKDGPYRGEFNFLQIRPMVVGSEHFEVRISPREIERAFCFSTQVLGHGKNEKSRDIVYVKPAAFDPARTREIATEIATLNSMLIKKQRPYLLIGPGRWGSADPWLGIPVKWQDISGVGAMIELRNQTLKAEASQGTHFFQNMTSLGIPYLTVNEDNGNDDFIDWQWLESLPAINETDHLRHVRLKKPFLIKIDGAASQGIICRDE